MAAGVLVDSLQAPFVANDHGDVYVYDDTAAMHADIEAADASTMEFFDATGRPIRASVEQHVWHIDGDQVDDADPGRLTSILRSYFARLPKELAEFSARAAAASSLKELVELRRELATVPDPGRWGKLLRRSWG